MANIPSNEEIVEKLATMDLGQSTSDQTSLPNPGSCPFEDQSSPESSPKISENIDDEDELIDELALQDRDLLLNDEEKQSFLDQARELKKEANELFKNGKFQETVILYTNALKICPFHFTNDRSILYANRAASKQKLDRKESAIQDCTKAIELNPTYVRAYLRRAVLYEQADKLDESLVDYKKVLEIDPGNRDALSATIRLPPKIEERNEKLKTEMLGKLKDLGNMVLKPFGLSTNNFQMTKDPNSGGYSINFVQNK